MFARSRYLFLLAMAWVVVAFPGASLVGDDKSPDASYQTALEARIANARKDGDVQAMVECAFALYPMEMGAKTKTPRYVGLLNQAADVVLEKKDAPGAKRFLELTSPLASTLAEGKSQKLIGLAGGKSTEQVVMEEAERAAGPLKSLAASGTDTVVKTSGSRDLAETLGTGVLACVRPFSTLASDPAPRLADYKFSYPKSNRASMYARMDWNGAFTGNAYSSKIWIDIEVSGGSLEILSVDYSDDCFIPAPDTRGLVALKRKLNEKLRR